MTVPTKLAWMKYTAETMHEYAAKWESCAEQLASMDTSMDEELLVTIFTESFGTCLKSRYGMALSALIKRT